MSVSKINPKGSAPRDESAGPAIRVEKTIAMPAIQRIRNLTIRVQART